MAAEVVSCPQCEKKLRVPENLIGQLVKCPTCGTNFTAEVGVPEKKAEPEEKKPTPSIRKKDADEDVPERVSRRGRKDDDDDDDRPSRRSRRSNRDDDDDDDDDDRPSRRRSRRSRRDDDDDDYGGRRRYLSPHRGALILVLGILALVTGLGFVLGPIAWIMGNNDLAEMRSGRMDREGEGMTQGGRICGMIATILVIVLFAIYGSCCCVGAMGGGGGGGRNF